MKHSLLAHYPKAQVFYNKFHVVRHLLEAVRGQEAKVQTLGRGHERD
ncbi:MAG: hypothetical protein ACYCT9_00285 [Leptospirillum sp.]